MGSGFLISAPLLAGVAGNYGVFCIAILLVVAYLIGEAMRFNIRHFEPIENEHGAAQEVALLSRGVLSGAHFISVAYYLQLLAAFALHIVGVDSLEAARWVTTGVLVFIGGVGALRGLDELERLDKYAMSLNLGMIVALLTGLLIYNIELVAAGHWRLPDIDANIDLHDARVVLGLLIVVQGFETSRYLGDNHPAEQRISTMRAAQIISTLIYLSFLVLSTVSIVDIKALSGSRLWRHDSQYRTIRRSSSSRWAKRAVDAAVARVKTRNRNLAGCCMVVRVWRDGGRPVRCLPHHGASPAHYAAPLVRIPRLRSASE